MARITGPVWKKSRRLGFSVLETGEELQKMCIRDSHNDGRFQIRSNGGKFLP